MKPLSVPCFPETLSALARRDALSPADQRRFELVLAASEASRVLHEVAVSFDVLPASLPEDAALVEQMAMRAAERNKTRPSRPLASRKAVWLGVGAALLTAVVAVAGVVGSGTAPVVGSPQQGIGIRQSPAAPPSPGHTASLPETPRPVAPPALATSPSSDLPSRPVAVPLATSGVSAGNRAAHLDSAAREMGPAELFRAANQARKRQDLPQAERYYHELEAEYPGSAEALLSHAVLGQLQLGRREYERALGHFNRYLELAPSGALAQEALHGKARALHQLGRASEEQAAWRSLLLAFPSSIYAEVAREHLDGGH